MLELARACDAEARIRLRTRLLERAESLPVTGSHLAGFGIAIEAERICDLARDGQADEVERAVVALQNRIGPTSASTFAREGHARSLFALGRTLAWRGDPASIQAAEDALREAAGAARELARNEWRALSLHTPRLQHLVLPRRGGPGRSAARAGGVPDQPAGLSRAQS